MRDGREGRVMIGQSRFVDVWVHGLLNRWQVFLGEIPVLFPFFLGESFRRL